MLIYFFSFTGLLSRKSPKYSLVILIFLGNKHKRIINIESDGTPKKRPCVEMRNDCLDIVHCTKDSGDLYSVQDLQSWKTLLRAAEVRQYAPILDRAKAVGGEELPTITYYRKCRNIFTLKRDLERC